MLIFNLSPLDLSPSCLQVCPILQQGMDWYALNVPGSRKVHTIQESVFRMDVNIAILDELTKVFAGKERTRW